MRIPLLGPASLLFIPLLLFFATTGQCEDVFVVTIKKAEKKEKSRWTLADWLLTKQKMALQDQWLALNSSANPFEFFVGGDMSSYDFTNTTPTNSTVMGHKRNKGTFGAYVTLFGLEGTWEESDESYKSWTGSFNARILGTSNQATNLTAFFGIYNNETNSDEIQNQYWGGKLTFYLIDSLGVEGVYKKYLTKKSQQEFDVSGEEQSGEVFLDFSFFRILANFFQEDWKFNKDGVDTVQKRKGARFGLKLFF